MPSTSRNKSSSAAPRGRLLIIAGVAFVVIAIAAAAAYWWFSGGALGAPGGQGSQLAETTGAAPALYAAPAGDHFLAAWPGEKGLVVQSLGASGPGQASTLRTVRYIAALVPLADGALAAMVDQFVRVNLNGAPTTELVSLVNSPPGAYRAFVVTGDTLAMAASMSHPEKGLVHFQSFHLDGNPAGSLATFDAGSTHPAEIGLARLGTGDYVMAWTRPTTVTAVLMVTVKADGTVVTPPVEVYTGQSGSALTGCMAAPTADGNAVIVWEDSSPGAHEIFAVAVGPAGALGPAQQVSGTPGEDDVAPSVVFDGKRTRIAWLSGLQGPANQRKGTGSVMVLEYGGSAPAVKYGGNGSIESYAIAGQGDAWVLATAMRTGESKWGIYGKVMSATP